MKVDLQARVAMENQNGKDRRRKRVWKFIWETHWSDRVIAIDNSFRIVYYSLSW